jgi:NADH:ubiquinone oxidoreductase subunit F (NADH-binding)
LDLPLDYDSLKAVGSMIGSGGLIIMDENTCMVDVARYFSDFNRQESCGKCTTCRIGTKRMLEILEKITSGRRGRRFRKTGEPCSFDEKRVAVRLGRSAPNPVLSTLKHFRQEFLTHINEKRCPAGVCPELSRHFIKEEQCKSCGICAKYCPAEAIIKNEEKRLSVSTLKNV